MAVTEVGLLARFAVEGGRFAGSVVKPKLFQPNRALKLSVFRIDGLLCAEIRDIGLDVVQRHPDAHRLHGWGESSESTVSDKGLQVEHDDVPPRHANIVGWPSDRGALNRNNSSWRAVPERSCWIRRSKQSNGHKLSGVHASYQHKTTFNPLGFQGSLERISRRHAPSRHPCRNRGCPEITGSHPCYPLRPRRQSQRSRTKSRPNNRPSLQTLLSSPSTNAVPRGASDRAFRASATDRPCSCCTCSPTRGHRPRAARASPSS